MFEAAREFLQAYETVVRNSWTSLSLGTRTGPTRHQKRNNNPVSGNIQSRQSRGSSNTLSAGKVMASLGQEGLLLCEFMPAGTTINADHYCETLENLHRAIENRRGVLTKGVRFHEDNAHLHIARVTNDLINKFGWDTVTHPPYSPDLAPMTTFPRIEETPGWDAFKNRRGA